MAKNFTKELNEFNQYKPLPNAEEVYQGLWDVPRHWSITPLKDKKPYRKGWQTEEFLDHKYQIAVWIAGGEKTVSTRGNTYRRYASGYGVRTGDYSDGLLAIDVDGASALPLLQEMFNTHSESIPVTASWTSGKPGRSQLAFQIPEHRREEFKEFKRSVVTEYNGLRTLHDEDDKPVEILEFRYNNVQSALPPSRHPSTGAYHWINKPNDTGVAIAPNWLCDFIASLAKKEHKNVKAVKADKDKRAIQWAEHKTGKSGVTTDVVSFLEFEVLPKLEWYQIYNWSGHNFQFESNTYKGVPPWRHSVGGKSFHVWWDNEKWAWQDKQEGCGGSAVQYRWKLKGGTGTPKGKDFIEIVKELAQDAGVLHAFPEKKVAATSYCTSANDDAADENPEIDFNNEKTLKQQLEEKSHKQWQDGSKFTPTVIINKPYVEFKPSDIPIKSILAIKAGLGQGKTTATMKACIEAWKGGSIWLGHRNSLQIQIAGKANEDYEGLTNAVHIHDSGAADVMAQKDTTVTLCVDSITKYHKKENLFQGKTIVIDELMSFLDHLLNSKHLSRNRLFCIRTLQMALRSCDRVIVMDGHMTDWGLQYIIDLVGETRNVIKFYNEHKPEPFDITVLDGVIKEGNYGDKIDKRDYSPLSKKILDAAKVNIKFGVCSDSKDFLTALHNLLLEQGCKGLLVTSETITAKTEDNIFMPKNLTQKEKDEKKPKNEVLAFLRSPNRWIEDYKPAYILYSPTADSGLDVNIKNYFQYQYCFFNNVIYASAAKQMIARLRDSKIKRYIWISEVAPGESYDFSDCNADTFGEAMELANKAYYQAVWGNGLLDTEENYAKFILEKAIEYRNSPNHKTFNILAVRQKYERINGKKCLIEILRQDGHSIKIERMNVEEETGKRIAEAKKAVRMDRCQLEFMAPMITKDKYQTLKADPCLDKEGRAMVLKYEKEQIAPGITLTENWSVDFIHKVNYLEKTYFQQLQRNHLFEDFINCEDENKSIIKQIEKNRLNQFSNWQLRVQDFEPFYSDIKGDLAKFAALKKAGIQNLLKDGVQWSKDSKEVEDFFKVIETVPIQEALFIKVQKRKERRVATKIKPKNRIKFIRKWAEWLGYPIRSTGSKGFYKLDAEEMIKRDRVVVLDLLAAKFEEYRTGAKPAVILGQLESSIASEIELPDCMKPKLEVVVSNEVVEESPYIQPELELVFSQPALQQVEKEQKEMEPDEWLWMPKGTPVEVMFMGAWVPVKLKEAVIDEYGFMALVDGGGVHMISKVISHKDIRMPLSTVSVCA